MLVCMHTFAIHEAMSVLSNWWVGADKAVNLSQAVEKVREDAQNSANIVALPVSSHCCICAVSISHLVAPGVLQQSLCGCQYFKEYAEEVYTSRDWFAWTRGWRAELSLRVSGVLTGWARGASAPPPQ